MLIRQTVLLSILGSITLMPLLAMPVMLGALVDGAGMSERQVGWVAAIGGLGGALAAIPIALRVHRINLRRLGLLGLMLLVVADGLSGLVGRVPDGLFLSLRFLAGVGGAAAYAAVMATFARQRDPEKSYGAFMMIQYAFSAAGLYGLPLLLPFIGAEGMYVLLAALDLAALGLIAQVPKATADQTVGEGRVEWRIVFSAAALFCLLGIGLFEAANTAHFAYAERFGVWFGLAQVEIGVVLALATLLGIPAAYGVICLGNRFGRLKTIALGMGGQVIALAIIFTPTGLGAYALAMCLLSMAWAFTLPYIQALEAWLDPGGSVVTAGTFFTGMGGALGPAIAAEVLGDGRYANILMSCIALYAVSLACVAMCIATVRRNPS